MVDIVITPANVVAGTGAVIEKGTAGATITAGQVVYKEASSSKFKLADSNSGTAEVQLPYGIALNGASNLQPLSVQTKGPITIGATLVAGSVYYLSETPGGIEAVADVGAGEQVSVLGVATSTTVLNIGIVKSGVTL